MNYSSLNIEVLITVIIKIVSKFNLTIISIFDDVLCCGIN